MTGTIDRATACELVRRAVVDGVPRSRVTVNKDHNIGTVIRVRVDWGHGYHRVMSAPHILDTPEKVASFVSHAIKELNAWFDRRMTGSMD